ncbi:MAG: YoaK family protein [Cloacibacillus sp.]
MMAARRISESLRIALLLAVAGGFLDAYTYVLRGGVFANAQTGNIVLLGISLFEANLGAAFRYLIPIAAFAAGIFTTECVRERFSRFTPLHWRQLILLIECAALTAVAFISEQHNIVANAAVSFVCSLQVESFRKVHGSPYATTMCTGNLRSAAENLFNYMIHKEPENFYAARNYFIIIGAFVTGAGVGALAAKICGHGSVLFAAALLAAAAVIMFKEKETA